MRFNDFTVTKTGHFTGYKFASRWVPELHPGIAALFDDGQVRPAETPHIPVHKKPTGEVTWQEPA